MVRPEPQEKSSSLKNFVYSLSLLAEVAPTNMLGERLALKSARLCKVNTLTNMLGDCLALKSARVSK